MRPAGHHLSINATRADALFVSALQCSDEPTARQIQDAITVAVRAFGGRGCAARVAQEFGDHPDTAVARMRWARDVTGAVFGGSAVNSARVRPLAPGTPAQVGRAA
ncbi:MAG TPA: hypothetical protein VGF32_10280 [Streptosporangiaceae bacterium]|jgi:hypothetical protein